MSDPITDIAVAASVELVKSMTTDAWQAIRAQLVKLLGRGNAVRESQEAARLDATHASVTAANADSSITNDHVQAWQEALADVLRVSPASAQELRKILALSDGNTGTQVTNISSGPNHGTLIQAGEIHGGIHNSGPTVR